MPNTKTKNQKVFIQNKKLLTQTQYQTPKTKNQKPISHIFQYCTPMPKTEHRRFGENSLGKLIKLTAQNQSEDEEHTALLECMSKGETITAHDLRNYKTLNVSDEEFEFATILTPGNRERQEFNHIQANQWARKHRTNVVRWPTRIREKNLERQTKKPTKC